LRLGATLSFTFLVSPPTLDHFPCIPLSYFFTHTRLFCLLQSRDFMFATGVKGSLPYISSLPLVIPSSFFGKRTRGPLSPRIFESMWVLGGIPPFSVILPGESRPRFTFPPFRLLPEIPDYVFPPRRPLHCEQR